MFKATANFRCGVKDGGKVFRVRAQAGQEFSEKDFGCKALQEKLLSEGLIEAVSVKKADKKSPGPDESGNSTQDKAGKAADAGKPADEGLNSKQAPSAKKSKSGNKKGAAKKDS